MTLSDLCVGDRARVVGVTAANGMHRRRLLAMGLIPGIEIAVVRFAPLGDPMELKVRGSALAVCIAEAAALRVEKL